MRRNSVVYKLFVITSVTVIALFAIVMLLESMFFERFYRTMKMSELEQQTTSFAQAYEQVNDNDTDISKLLGQYMNEYDVSIALLNQQFQQQPFDPYYIMMQVGQRTITLLLPKEGMTFDELPTGLTIGETLTVDGIYMDEKDLIMHPVHLKSEGTKLEMGLVREQGIVKDMLIPSNRSYNPFYQDLLVKEALEDWKPILRANSQLDHFTTIKWNDQWSGVEYAIAIKQISQNDHYVLLMTSLQPVNEAVDMVKKYVLYIFPIIIIAVFILALIYSRIISKPLVRLNGFAGKLAKLDFSEKAPLQSNDEFGQLSNRLVELSQNLDAALKQLSERNMQLQTEIAEKQRSEQLRKELVANISHELKTPLAIVKGYAEGLQDGVAKEKSDAYLTHIVNESDRMNELIMDMLELTKYEVKSIQLKSSHFNLEVLVQEVIRSFSQQLEEKQLRVALTSLLDEESIVFADKKRITQVVINLMSNAIRHASDNSELTISINYSKDEMLMISIHNVGEHIPNDQLSRIWEQFYRVEKARDRKSGGTGLGLAIVKHILDLHHSQYGVKNIEDGVEFYFTLEESGGNKDEV